MKIIHFTPLVALLAGLIFLGNTNKMAWPVSIASDGSIAAFTHASASLPLGKIKLPPGFSIALYAEVPGARSMVISPSGTLFVGTQSSGFVYAVKDTNG
ncbi:MAG TPA: hypothetical protein VGZ71_11775, partial [Puia sp.]|nr:hypothetical protein [Puia sp.]